jgi:hypothetical protein
VARFDCGSVRHLARKLLGKLTFVVCVDLRIVSLPVLSSQAKPELTRMVVRAVGVEPTRALQPCGFSYRLRLSPP